MKTQQPPAHQLVRRSLVDRKHIKSANNWNLEDRIVAIQSRRVEMEYSPARVVVSQDELEARGRRSLYSSQDTRTAGLRAKNGNLESFSLNVEVI